jgi:predicted DNA-binding transcriptional regulator YafY
MLVRSPDAGAYRMMGREKMKAARQQAIVNLLIQHKSLTTEALAAQLHVSKETIRRDLSELQIQGKFCATTAGLNTFIGKTRTVVTLSICV